MSPPRRRSLKDAARDPLAAKPQSAKLNKRALRHHATDGLPVVFQVTIGLLIGFVGGCFKKGTLTRSRPGT